MEQSEPKYKYGIGRKLQEGERKITYQAKMSNSSVYHNMLRKMDKSYMEQLLMEFRENVVEEIKKGEKINYSARRLFRTLSLKAGIMTS